MEKKVVIVRLMTGEELLTTHVKTDGETFTFEKTLQLYIAPATDPSKPPQIGFVPFMAHSQAMEKVAINKVSVVLMIDPVPALLKEYQRVTGSIITPPKTGLIIP